MVKTVQQISESLDLQTMLARPLAEWQPTLAAECQVYQIDGGGYVAKSFSQINYRFCDVDTAKTILIDNVFLILKNKYFRTVNDEVLNRTEQIVRSMTTNLKSTLHAITFNKHNIGTNASLKYVQYLPDGCVAFRNGVYDFRNAKWLFKYDILDLPTGLRIISYTHDYIISWYFNFDFEPLDFSLTDISLSDFIDALKDLNEVQRNYCFELVYNMSHDSQHKFNEARFEHLCQILGYTCLNSFAQYFVLLIGAGQNGKNSLFDGCFTSNVVPKPVSIDLESIEKDRFVTGTLEGAAHNIYLETSAKTYRESRTIKSLTGSADQTIEHKGVGRYPSVINCKYVFAGNDKTEIKFADTTTGFVRRINMFEIFYTWDKQKQFLKNGDYYDASFASDLHELKYDITCSIIFVYLAMYGVKSATNDFTSPFAFTHNEWSAQYAEINHDLKDKLEKISISKLFDWARESNENMSKMSLSMFTDSKKSILNSIVDDNGNKLFETMKQLINVHQDVVIDQETGETEPAYLGAEFVQELDDFYISLRLLQEYLCVELSAKSFTAIIQKIYGTNCIVRMTNNISCIHCTFKNGNLRIIR